MPRAGAELRLPDGSPAAALTDSLLERLKDAGYLVGKTGSGRNVLTFLPPLIVESEDLKGLVAQLDRELASG
jgi:4-aminobutyrate aminotransferase-like enzyme